MKKALIFWGGWDGHQPELVSQRFKSFLESEGFSVESFHTQECLSDLEHLKTLDLIIPCWTSDTIDGALTKNVALAVAQGTGLAGCHGGMCDAFRNDVEWQFMTGGQWVSHPGSDGTSYTVNVSRNSSPITQGIEDFPVCSEQYYMHVDPSIEVLATTRFPVAVYYHCANKPVDMPVVWTKYWGNGRVFYNSLGHHDDVFDNSPEAWTIMQRGMLWAAQGKEYAVANGLTVDRFKNDAKMY
ncbi:MAG: hypothetical protein GX051_05330 [Clostridiales bacterium]|nr:hypothetical protein [Clostridiales bacterium]